MFSAVSLRMDFDIEIYLPILIYTVCIDYILTIHISILIVFVIYNYD